MFRLVPTVILMAGLAQPVASHENLQTRIIQHEKQARCIVRGSEVHKVYLSMLTYLQRDLREWNKLKIWVDQKMPLISPSIEIHRGNSQSNLSDLEGVPICPADS